MIFPLERGRKCYRLQQRRTEFPRLGRQCGKCTPRGNKDKHQRQLVTECGGGNGKTLEGWRMSLRKDNKEKSPLS